MAIGEKKEKSSFAKSRSLEFECKNWEQLSFQPTAPGVCFQLLFTELKLVVVFFLTSIYKPLLYRDGPDLASILCCILADVKSKLGLSPEMVIVLCEVPNAALNGPH